MKNITVNGLHLRFDWGTMELIGALTGKDPVSPLEGIDSLTHKSAAVLAGAYNRQKEREGSQSLLSLSKANEIIREMSPGQLVKLMTAYNDSTKVDADENDVVVDEAKKNSSETTLLTERY